MKIGYMFIELLFGCYFSTSFAASEHEKVTKNMVALSLSASPSGASFIPPSTPPIPTSMVSPYREPFIEGVADYLEILYASEKKVFKNESTIIIERVLSQNELPIIFTKVPITEKVVEEEKERPLSVGVDPHENKHEILFSMDDEE